MSSKKMFIFFLLTTIVVGFFCFSGLALADDYGLDKVAESSGLKSGGTDLPGMMGGVLGTALSFIGVIFFVLMVFGGFMWMTARGNEEQTKKAMGTITAAVIGLVIVLSSYTVVSFIFKSAQIADLTEAPATETPVSTVAEKDKLCNAAKAGWTCNSINMCSGNIPTNTVTSTCETTAGKNNCLVNGADTKPLCTGDAVCCQAKPASAVPDSWCFDPKTAKCEKLADVGAANCLSPKETVSNVTEKDCYEEKIKNVSGGFNCSADGSNGNCATSFTGQICNKAKTPNVCTDKPSVENKGACVSSEDCATGVCTDGQCKYVAPCPVNTKNPGTLTCSLVTCGSGHECTDDKQCASDESRTKAGGHCVDGKCHSGEPQSFCDEDSQCKSGHYCTSEGTPSCCLPKLDRGENCFGMNNACKSGTCINKAGFDVCE